MMPLTTSFVAPYRAFTPVVWAALQFENGGRFTIRFSQLKAQMLAPDYADWVLAHLAQHLANADIMGNA